MTIEKPTCNTSSADEKSEKCMCCSTTNTDEETLKKAECGCLRYWEALQQEAILKLSNERNSSANLYKFEMGYEARARRAASVYASIFLEKDARFGGEEKYRGRYYWMGLGAFASKTVAAVFPFITTELAYLFSDVQDYGRKARDIGADIPVIKWGVKANDYVLSYILNYISSDEEVPLDDPELLNFAKMIDFLAAGNLWLYMDIVPWHYHWGTSKDSFVCCLCDRDVSQYQQVTKSMKKVPWFNLIGKINHLKATTRVEAAFAILPKIESIFDEFEGNVDQQYNQAGDELLEHLIELAWHEQEHILQPLVWEDWAVIVGAGAEYVARNNQHILLLDPIAPYFAKATYLASEKVKEIAMPNSTLILTSDYTVKAVTKSRWAPWSQEKYGEDRHNHPDALIKDVKEEPFQAPYKDTNIPDLNSRMIWINEAAEKYHRIMLHKGGRAFLHAELEIISGWGDSTLTDTQHDKSNEGQTEIDITREDIQ